MTKEDFLEKLQTERRRWTALLEQVGESCMTVPNVIGYWSIKDLIAHIMSYEQFVTDYLTVEIEQNAGYKPSETQSELDAFLKVHGYPDFGSPLLDDDGPNAWVVEHYRTHTLDDVIAIEEQAFEKLVHRVEALHQEQVTIYHETIANNTFVHYAEHAGDVRDWLEGEVR